MRIVLALLVLAFAGRAYAGIVVRSPGDTIIERCEEDFIACMELPSAPKCDEKLMRCVETWANLIPGEMYREPLLSHPHGEDVAKLVQEPKKLGGPRPLDTDTLETKVKDVTLIIEDDDDNDDDDDDTILGDMYEPAPLPKGTGGTWGGNPQRFGGQEGEEMASTSV